MSLPTAQKHYLRILRLWPRDPARNATFHKFLTSRIESRFLAPTTASNAASTSTPPIVSSTKDNTAQVHPIPDAATSSGEAGRASDAEQMNAMYSLLENRYSKQYPVSDELLRPGFRPTYYEELAQELEAAPQRNWLQRQWLRWSNIVRFS